MSNFQPKIIRHAPEKTPKQKQKTRQLVKIEFDGTQMLDLAEKDFQEHVIKMFKELKENVI